MSWDYAQYALGLERLGFEVLSRGVAVEEPYDSLSLTPTVLALMGRREPDPPGALILEVGETPCGATR